MIAVEMAHVEYLFELSTRGENAVRWRFHGAQISLREFTDSLGIDVLTHFVVVDPVNEPIGYVVCYGANQRNGFAFVGVIVDESKLGEGVGGEAGALFITHLFDTYPLRKLYIEIPDFSVASIEHRMNGMFEREGIWRDHFFAKGQYWDMHIFATYRRTWDGVLEAALREREVGLRLGASVVIKAQS